MSMGSNVGGIAIGNAPASMLAKLGFSVTLSPTAFIWAHDFNTLGTNLKDFKEPLTRAIRKVAMPSIDKNFEMRGRPVKWAPNTEDTLAMRASMGIVAKGILEVTGNLRKAASSLGIWTITSDNAYVADLPEEVKYGRLHQGGYSDRGKTVPARPFIMFQEEDMDDIHKVFDDWMGEKVAEIGFT